MTTPEYPQQRSNSTISNNNNSNSNRHEFTVNDIEYEQTGGCFVSYRKIAFAFVFFLAMIIAAAFIGVYIDSLSDKDEQDNLILLVKGDSDVPEEFTLAPSIKPFRYHLELEPILDEKARNSVRLKGHVVIEFRQDGNNGPSQLVLNSKHLSLQEYRLISLTTNGNSTIADSDSDEHGPRRNKRELEETTNDWISDSPVKDTLKESVITQIRKNTNDTDAGHIHMSEKPNPRYIVKISGTKTDETSSLLIFLLEKPLQHGNYSLEIKYEANLDHRVVFFKNLTKNNENRLLLASRLKPVNAPRLFPTLDEQKSKPSFVLTILHPSDMKVLSNTPAVNSSAAAESLISTTFTETRAMSAHDLAFVIGQLHSLGEITIDDKRSLVYWGSGDRLSQEFYLHDKIAPAVNAFEKIFEGAPRPNDKLDLTTLPIDYDGLSAPGLITFRESLFYAAVSAPAITKTKALLNLIGLVGQQWLGGLVDAKNWTDAWYIESSVVYFQYDLIDKIDQSLEASDSFLVDVQLEALENDGYKVSKALSDTVNRTRIEAFDLYENYRKGACLISMLHATLNESAFKNGYNNFLRRWSYSIADSDTFLHTLVGNATIDGNTSFYEAFTSWTRQSGYPMINVTWDRDNGTVKINQSKFNFEYSSLDDDEDEEDENQQLQESTNVELLWWVPLTYVTNGTNWSTPSQAWIKGKQGIILENVAKGNNESWILFNVDKRGYYRVNYDEANWRSLCLALRQSHNEFPAATRAALVDDALSLARQGSLSYDLALDFLVYFGPSERNYLPWKALARHALQLDFALYETAAYSSFQEYMTKLVGPLFDEMEPKIDQGSPLAMLAIQLGCIFEYHGCTNWAKSKWEGIFRNNVENMLVRHIRETVYCVGAERGGQEELTYLEQKFVETNDRDEKDRLLSALGCFQAPWILQRVLNEILETDKYEEGDIRVILRSYAKNPAAAQAARRFVQENWKEIVKRFSSSYWTMKAFVEASTSLLFSQHDLNEFNEFRDQNLNSLVAMGHWVALNEIKAASWVSRLKKSMSVIQHWFKNHTITSA